MTPAADRRDPLVTDGDKYSLVLENERVRVLRYRDKPGDKTTPHEHPDYVMTSRSAFKRRLHFPDGRTVDVDVKIGDTMFLKGHTHVGENIGTTDTDVILVELK